MIQLYVYRGAAYLLKMIWLQGFIFFQNITSASDYPSSDTHKLSLDRVAKKGYRGVYLCSLIQLYVYGGAYFLTIIKLLG